MSERDMKRGVVLSGGGANGAYEAGVLSAIFGGDSPASKKRSFEADSFTGTSVGSFNAAFMVSRTAGGKSCLEAAKELETAWVDKIAEHPAGCNNGAFRLRADFFDYLNPRCLIDDPLRPLLEMAEDSAFFAQQAAQRGMAFLDGKGSLTRRAVEFFDLASALSTTPLHDLVVENIDLEAVVSPKAKLLNVIATNWDLGKVSVFRNRAGSSSNGSAYAVRPMTKANGHQAILGSSAIPGVFPPVKIASDDGSGSYYYVDGGVLMNTPLSPAIQVGARDIHVVYFEPRLEKLPEDYLPNTLETTNRFLFVAVANLIDQDIEEVRKVNAQAAIADQIKPLVDKLPKSKRPKALQTAVDRAEAFIETLAGRRQVTVHKHYPRKSLGGVLSLLDFNRNRMLDLVEMGYNDAVDHDCEVNCCVLTES